MEKRREFLKKCGSLLTFTVLPASAISSVAKLKTKDNYISSSQLLFPSSAHGGRFAQEVISKYFSYTSGSESIYTTVIGHDSSHLGNMKIDKDIYILIPASKDDFLWHAFLSYKVSKWFTKANALPLGLAENSVTLTKREFAEGIRKVESFYKNIKILSSRDSDNKVKYIEFKPSSTYQLTKDAKSILTQLELPFTEDFLNKFTDLENIYDGTKFEKHPSTYFKNSEEIYKWLKASRTIV